MSGTSLIRRLLWLFAIIIGVTLLDQATKQWIVSWLGPGTATSRFELLGSVIAFEYLENRGAAFGMFQQGTMVLAILSAIIIVVGIVAMVRFASDQFWLAASIALVLGGAMGNAIDRFSRGYVVDFLAFGLFWKFNLADSAVTIGAILTFVLLWRAESGDQANGSTQEQNT